MTETLDIDLNSVNAAEPILEVSDLTVTFPNPKGDVHAVRGVDYAVRPGDSSASSANPAPANPSPRWQ